MAMESKDDQKTFVAPSHAHVENEDGERYLEDVQAPNKKAERALKLKSDLLILPIMSLTYLTAYLVSMQDIIHGAMYMLKSFRTATIWAMLKL